MAASEFLTVLAQPESIIAAADRARTGVIPAPWFGAEVPGDGRSVRHREFDGVAIAAPQFELVISHCVWISIAHSGGAALTFATGRPQTQ